MGLTKFIILVTFSVVVVIGAYFISSRGNIDPTSVGLICGVLLMYGIEFIGEHCNR